MPGGQMIPMAIRHTGKRANKEDALDLIRGCTKNVHLTSRGGKLLLCYATCRTGFRPSKKYVFEKTGINPPHLYQVRKELTEMRIINIDRATRTIFVDWRRIRLYSALDPRMTDKHRRHTTVGPFTTEKQCRKLGEGFRPRAAGRDLTREQQHFYSVVEDMTEFEWESLLWSWCVRLDPANTITISLGEENPFQSIELPEVKDNGEVWCFSNKLPF